MGWPSHAPQGDPTFLGIFFYFLDNNMIQKEFWFQIKNRKHNYKHTYIYIN